MLAYGVYNYGLYVFGSAFNALLVHVTAFSSSVFALALALSALDVAGIAARLRERTPARWISGLLAFLALGLVEVAYRQRGGFGLDGPGAGG